MISRLGSKMVFETLHGVKNKLINTITINLRVRTTMYSIYFEDLLALKRAGLVSTFQTVHSAHLQELKQENYNLSEKLKRKTILFTSPTFLNLF